MKSTAPVDPGMMTFFRIFAVFSVVGFFVTLSQQYELERKRKIEEAHQNAAVIYRAKLQDNATQMRARLNTSPLQLRVFEDYIECLNLDYNQPIAKDRDFVCSAAAEYRVKEASPEELSMFKTSLAFYRDRYHSVQTSYASLLDFETAPK